MEARRGAGRPWRARRARRRCRRRRPRRRSRIRRSRCAPGSRSSPPSAASATAATRWAARAARISTRSALVAADVRGDKIGPAVRNGRVDKGMPAFTLGDADLAAIVAFIHDQKTQGGVADRRPPRRGRRRSADRQRRRGQEVFRRAPARSATRRAAISPGIATRLQGLALLQRMLYPAPAAAAPSRGEGHGDAAVRRDGQPARSPTATSSRSRSPIASGRVSVVSDAPVKFTVDDPLQAHVEQLGKYTDDDMHNVLAYLQTLR